MTRDSAGSAGPGEASGDGRSWRAVGTFSAGMTRIPHLAELLGAGRVVHRPGDGRAADLDAIVGWGEKRNTEVAVAFARRHGIPYWRAEDGFLRSVGLGAAGEPPLSIVLDDQGIYYDARRPSRLERLLAGDGPGDPLADDRLLDRARRAMARIRDAQLSKYNDTPTGPVDLDSWLGPRRGRERVLVVDQTRGDLSVGCGLADERSFEAMLDAALREHEGADVVVKIHPDVVAGKKQGYLERVRRDPRVRVLSSSVNPIALLREIDRAYVATSQLGFEALVAGVPVTCFGAPFYAGWGLTDDRQPIPRRTARRTLEQVFAAAYILYPRYIDGDTGAPCRLEDAIDHLALQREVFARNRGAIYCFGFPVWKRRYVRAYLRSPEGRIEFPRGAAHAERLGADGDAKVVVWGREHAAASELAARHGAPVWRMEDGFLRSVGLGSDLAMPASLALDRDGIYYDSTRPSELENLLQKADFTDDEIARARALREAIVAARISKYNVGDTRAPTRPGASRVVLVPGQVSNDASIRLGCPDIRTPLVLLRHVRRRNPDAYIVFKPHPDVVSGNRRGHVGRAAALTVCDRIETEASIDGCLAVADEVHTLTSLVGFEALLRGVRVVTYGQPFYAGWGLTEDRHPVSRRSRALTIDELVAGALIRYPRYLNPATGRFSTPEAILARLADARRTDRSSHRIEMTWPARQLRKLVHVYKGMVHAP